MSMGNERLLSAIFILLLAILVAGMIYLDHELDANAVLGFSSDDAYIFLTYARNFLRGNFCQFNIGETSWGVTSSLWMIMLIPLSCASFIWIKILGLALLAASAFVVMLIIHALTDDSISALLAALLSIIAGPALFHAVSGMDATLFTAYCMLAILIYGKSHSVRFVIMTLCVIAPFVRPEAILLPICFAFESLLMRRWRDFAPILAATIAGAVLFAAFNMLLTGLPLPTTFYAKHGAPSMAYLGTILSSLRHDYSLLLYLPLVGLIPLVKLALRQRSRLALTLIIWVLIAPVALVIGSGAYEPLDRYTCFLLPAWCIFAAMAAFQIGAWINILMRKIPQKISANLIMSGMLAIALLNQSKWVKLNAIATEDINSQHVAIAAWVRENTQPGDIIAAHDIGALGYFADRRILDVRGLIFANALKSAQFPLTSVSSDSFAIDIIIRLKPQWLVIAKSSFPFLWRNNPALRVANEWQPRNTIKCATAFVILRVNEKCLEYGQNFSRVAPAELLTNPDYAEFADYAIAGDTCEMRAAYKNRRAIVASILKNNIVRMPEGQMFPLARYALSAIPDDTLAAFIAEAFMMRGEIDSAGMILRRRFDQMPSAIVSLALAKAHILRGRTAVADSLLHLALELEPQNPSNYIALAEFFAAIDLPDSASFFIERCNELIPDWKDCSK